MRNNDNSKSKFIIVIPSIWHYCLMESMNSRSSIVALYFPGFYLPYAILARLVHRFVDAEWRISFGNFIQIMALLTKAIGNSLYD